MELALVLLLKSECRVGGLIRADRTDDGSIRCVVPSSSLVLDDDIELVTVLVSKSVVRASEPELIGKWTKPEVVILEL